MFPKPIVIERVDIYSGRIVTSLGSEPIALLAT